MRPPLPPLRGPAPATPPSRYPKLDPQLKSDRKGAQRRKVKKVENFPKPGVFLRFFPSKLKQNGKSTPYIVYRKEDNYYATKT
jgi:hypothetical protein